MSETKNSWSERLRTFVGLGKRGQSKQQPAAEPEPASTARPRATDGQSLSMFVDLAGLEYWSTIN